MNNNTIKDDIASYFNYLVNLYDSQNYSSLTVKYQFVFTEGDVEYHYVLSISEGKAVWEEGDCETVPEITIYSPVSVWFDVSCGKLNSTLGFITKKYHVKGDIKYLKCFNLIFGKKLNSADIYNIYEKKHDYEIKRRRKWQRPERVLIINGSPRKQKGYTYFYLNHFVSGVEKTGAKTEIIDIYDSDIRIEPCLGCFCCWKNDDGKCVIKDDAGPLVEKINSAYLTIYAFPLYISSIPSKLKALLDRQFVNVSSVFSDYDGMTRHPLKTLNEGYLALFSICGFPEKEHFNPLINTFKAISLNMHKPLISSIIRPAAEFFAKAVTFRSYLKDILRAMEEAGEELVLNGAIKSKTLKIVSSNFGIKKEKWRDYANHYWYLKKKTEI